jgi:hypothetical protein
MISKSKTWMIAFKEKLRQTNTKMSLKGLSVNYWPIISQSNNSLSII